jgi:outer membrane immunogenic protein
MKRTLLGSVAILAWSAVSLASTASAADLGPPPPAPAPAWTWTGFYAGLQGGGGFGTDEDNVTAAQTCGVVCGTAVPIAFSQSSFAMTGLFGGATAGFNWQLGRVVLGVEGDFSGSGIAGTGDCQNSFGLGLAFGPSSACKTTMSWFATADARLALALDRTLLYVKGGAAWAHLNHTEQVGTNIGSLLFASGSVSNTPMGFNVGAGVEYALWGGWSAKIEYDYMDLGGHAITMPLATVAPPGIVFNETTTDRVTVNLVRVGLNLRFN